MSDARIVGHTTSAIIAIKVYATNVDVSDSNVGIIAIQKLRGTNVTANGTNNHGVAGGLVRVEGLVAQGNRAAGVAASRITLLGSTVTGNGTGGDGGDLIAKRKPRLSETTCGKSQVMDAPPGTTWGVCSSD